MAGKDNLKPKTSAKARGKLGGIRSGQVKRERKLMSQIYAEFLINQFDVEMGGIKKKILGQELVKRVTAKIMARSDSASVQLMREIREATEGTTHNLNVNADIEKVRTDLIKKLNKLNGNN